MNLKDGLAQPNYFLQLLCYLIKSQRIENALTLLKMLINNKKVLKLSLE